MILDWAAFIAILGYMWPVSHRLDTPVLNYFTNFALLASLQNVASPSF